MSLSRALRSQAPARHAQTPRPVANAVGSVFRSVSTLRSARSLHPDGVVHEAVVEITRPAARLAGAPLVAVAGSHDAVVRLSRGLGLPHALPDVHGLTVRLVDAHGDGLHQDFPLATSLDGPLVHHLLMPARGFFSMPYSSILLYRISGELSLVGARAATRPVAADDPFDQLERTAAREEVRFDLALAKPMGRWTRIGTIRLGERVPGADGERLRFNPWNTGGGIEPTGPFMGLREVAYRESQRGWAGEVT
jgi:hypothetical protein